MTKRARRVRESTVRVLNQTHLAKDRETQDPTGSAITAVTESIRDKAIVPFGGRFAALYANLEESLEAEFEAQEQLASDMVQVTSTHTTLLREGLKVATAELEQSLRKFSE
jgi:hypothetical protein